MSLPAWWCSVSTGRVMTSWPFSLYTWFWSSSLAGFSCFGILPPPHYHPGSLPLMSMIFIPTPDLALFMTTGLVLLMFLTDTRLLAGPKRSDLMSFILFLLPSLLCFLQPLLFFGGPIRGWFFFGVPPQPCHTLFLVWVPAF